VDLGGDVAQHWLCHWPSLVNVRYEGGWSVMVGGWVLALVPQSSIFSTIRTLHFDMVLEMLQPERWGPLFTRIGTFCWMGTKPRAHKPVWFLSDIVLCGLSSMVAWYWGHVNTEQKCKCHCIIFFPCPKDPKVCFTAHQWWATLDSPYTHSKSSQLMVL